MPLCPTCKRVAKRVFLTPPNIGSVKQSNINRILDDVLPSQNLANYTNATGYPKPTFTGIYQNNSGNVAGWGLDSLPKLLPGVNKDTPLSKFDVNNGVREQVSLPEIAASLPKAVTAVNGVQVGTGRRAGALSELTVVEKRWKG
jgi:hypothetical protein